MQQIQRRTALYIENNFDFMKEKDRKDATRLMFFDLKPFKDAQVKSKQSN